MVLHGDRDTVVVEINAIQLVRQYLVLNGRLAAVDGSPAALPDANTTTTITLADGRTQTTDEFTDAGRTLVRLVRVAQLGHAWSGGDDALPYNDAHLPNATALLEAFVDEHCV